NMYVVNSTNNSIKFGIIPYIFNPINPSFSNFQSVFYENNIELDIYGDKLKYRRINDIDTPFSFDIENSLFEILGFDNDTEYMAIEEWSYAPNIYIFNYPVDWYLFINNSGINVEFQTPTIRKKLITHSILTKFYGSSDYEQINFQYNIKKLKDISFELKYEKNEIFYKLPVSNLSFVIEISLAGEIIYNRYTPVNLQPKIRNIATILNKFQIDIIKKLKKDIEESILHNNSNTEKLNTILDSVQNSHIVNKDKLKKMLIDAKLKRVINPFSDKSIIIGGKTYNRLINEGNQYDSENNKIIITPQEIQPQEIQPQEMTPQEIQPQEMVPQEE
ncbi:MAG: hypothetical protein GQ557_01425, partial [Mycoplasmataceae bacterium]|nr:hypothetical protein [Mycoplasmataceae bacterium]